MLAEELAQETFYRATRGFLGWRGEAPAAWLLAIARRVLADEARRGARLVPLRETIEPGWEEFDALPERPDGLAALSPRERQLLELVYVEGYSHAEVAAMLGTTTGAIKTALWRARRALAGAYEKEADERRSR